MWWKFSFPIFWRHLEFRLVFCSIQIGRKLVTERSMLQKQSNKQTMYMLDQNHNQIVHSMDWKESIFQTKQSKLEIIQLLRKKSKMRIWNFFSHWYKPGPFLLEPIGKEYQLLQLQQLAPSMLQNYGNKLASVFWDNIWKKYLVWNNQLLHFQRGYSGSLLTLPFAPSVQPLQWLISLFWMYTQLAFWRTCDGILLWFCNRCLEVVMGLAKELETTFCNTISCIVGSEFQLLIWCMICHFVSNKQNLHLAVFLAF